MTGCSCSHPSELRLSGEVYDRKPAFRADVIGGGEKIVRVRCSTCGGKAGYVGSDLLTELFGLPLSEIHNGRCLSEDEQLTLGVDLI